jgi:hypothetical protein
MRALLIALIVGFSFSASAQQGSMEELLDFMTGSFDSRAQSEEDTAYYNIHLEMAQIWEDRNDGPWIYVEQAASWALEKPYRQRIYRLEDVEDGFFKSSIYTFEEPLNFAGKYAEPAAFSSLSPEMLSEREGCFVILQRIAEGQYGGETMRKTCKSELNGATWASSEVMMEAGKLMSWDRGWNDDDEQIWGAEKGPYIFVKKP